MERHLDFPAEHQVKLDKALFRAVEWTVVARILAEATKQDFLSRLLLDSGVPKDSLDFFRYHLKDAFEGVWYNLVPVRAFMGHQRRKQEKMPENLRTSFDGTQCAITTGRSFICSQRITFINHLNALSNCV